MNVGGGGGGGKGGRGVCGIVASGNRKVSMMD